MCVSSDQSDFDKIHGAMHWRNGFICFTCKHGLRRNKLPRAAARFRGQTATVQHQRIFHMTGTPSPVVRPRIMAKFATRAAPYCCRGLEDKRNEAKWKRDLAWAWLGEMMARGLSSSRFALHQKQTTKRSHSACVGSGTLQSLTLGFGSPIRRWRMHIIRRA